MVMNQVPQGDRWHSGKKMLNGFQQASSQGLGGGQPAADHVALATEAGHAAWNRCGHGGRGISTAPRTAASGSLLGVHCLSSSPSLKQKLSLCFHKPSGWLPRTFKLGNY